MADIDSIVVVGAGQAGAWTVDTLRREGFKGRIVLIGEEAHVPYERPPLSKGILAGRQEPDSCHLHGRQHYHEIGVELVLGVRAERLDREGQKVELSNGEAVAYDRLVLATGSRVRRLALPGAELPGVCYLRTLDESLALGARLRDGARVVLVGGGYIGMEVAATARGRGCRVTVVELQERVMARVVPDEIGRYLEAVHRDQGAEILTGLGVEGFERRGEDLAVLTGDGRALAADAIVVGIGIQPNVELAQDAGLEVDDGVLVDEFGRSSDPHLAGPPGPLGVLAERPEPGDRRGSGPVRWHRTLRRSPLVLVRSVRSQHPDRRPARGLGHHRGPGRDGRGQVHRHQPGGRPGDRRRRRQRASRPSVRPAADRNQAAGHGRSARRHLGSAQEAPVSEGSSIIFGYS
jgi:thioredoxin reductase